MTGGMRVGGLLGCLMVFHGVALGAQEPDSAPPQQQKFSKNSRAKPQAVLAKKLEIKVAFTPDGRGILSKEMLVTVVDPQNDSALLGLDLSLATPDRASGALLQGFFPLFWDALFMDFYGLAPFLWSTPLYQPTLESLSKRATRVCEAVMPGVVSSVTVKRAFLRPLTAGRGLGAPVRFKDKEGHEQSTPSI